MCAIFVTDKINASRCLSGKESACQCRRLRRCRFNPWVRKVPSRKKWQPTPVLLPGNPCTKGQTGSSPWGRRESDITELHKHAQLTSDKCKDRWHTRKQQREMSNLFNSKHFFIHTLSITERIDILKNCSQGGCMDQSKEGV